MKLPRTQECSFAALEADLNDAAQFDYRMEKALGLQELLVTNVQKNDDWVLLTVASKEPKLPEACPRCGCYQPKYLKHKVYVRAVRDIPIWGKQCVLDTCQRYYKCGECKKVVPEDWSAIPNGKQMTKRFREYVFERATSETFSRISEELAVSAHTVRDIFLEKVSELHPLSQQETPSVLGIDEIYLRKEGQYRKQPWVVLANGEERTFMELLRKRDRASLVEMFGSLKNPERVGVVTMDMYPDYRAAVREAMPQAFPVIDKFHVIKLIQTQVDAVRIRELSGGHRHKDLIRKRGDKLSQADVKKRDELFAEHPTLQAAYEVKEGFLKLYDFSDRKEAEAYFDGWRKSIPKDDAFAGFRKAARSIEKCRAEVFNYFDAPYTNAFVEGMNKVIRRIDTYGEGYGFEVMRGKILTHKHKRPTPKLDRSTLSMVDMGTLKFDEHLTYSIHDCGYESERDYGVPFDEILSDENLILDDAELERLEEREELYQVEACGG